MQVVQKSDPSRQRENTEHSACNETRACDVRSCIETFAEENAEEAAGNRAEQDCESGLFQRHTEEESYRKAESRLEHIFTEDSPAHAPVQIYALCRCNQACHKQGSAFRRAAENRQALIQIRWHVDLGDGGEDTEYRSPEYGFLESSPERRAKNPYSGLRYSVSSPPSRSEEHTSELQSLTHIVCRLLPDNITPKAA